MQFHRFVLAASAISFVACGGGEKGTDTTMMADTPTVSAMPSDSPPPSGGGAPITGTTHEVQMVGDATGYRFEPAAITVKAGDGIKFINVSGGPHNVAADPAKIPDDVEAALSANMPNQMAPLSGPLLTNPNEAYTISFAGIKPGTYELNCTPHLAFNMIIKVTVQ
ncbi:MAG: plastocyanin/azurin family copper-binding protein [Gemmatimonadaceae bacterium]